MLNIPHTVLLLFSSSPPLLLSSSPLLLFFSSPLLLLSSFPLLLFFSSPILLHPTFSGAPGDYGAAYCAERGRYFHVLGGVHGPAKAAGVRGVGGGSLTQTITIEFLENFGDLTLVNAYSLRAQNKMTVTEAVKGTKEGEVCAGRGNCDDLTGMCSCMAHFFSSDGYAGPGDRGDCGYMMVPDQVRSSKYSVQFQCSDSHSHGDYL